MTNKAVVTCFQCAGMHVCFGENNSAIIGIDREEARFKAQNCHQLVKGLPTEVINVSGRGKGMSRKKAQNLVDIGKATWIQNSTVQLI